MKYFLIVLFIAVLTTSCDRETEQHNASRKVAIEPPDVGGIDKFWACQAKPRRNLSAEEKCLIEKLSARCTAADDCLVSCITSPQGHQVGGGCAHVCFSRQYPDEPKPPGWFECKSLSVQCNDPPLADEEVTKVADLFLQDQSMNDDFRRKAEHRITPRGCNYEYEEAEKLDSFGVGIVVVVDRSRKVVDFYEAK